VTAKARSRAELIGDTAVEVLAGEGARGLTHRAVDRAAGLPPGSTSNYARTREALLKCALTRITELEAADAAASNAGQAEAAAFFDGSAKLTVDAVAVPIATILHRGLTRGRTRLLARYELALESTRRPELRAIYDEASRPFREPVVAMLSAAGSKEPERHARMLIAWCEGAQFDSIAGAGSAEPPSLQELTDGLRDLLSAMVER
jgi:DNA-binding transcriptional regulator YbjK